MKVAFALLIVISSVAKAEVVIDQDAITRESVYPKFNGGSAVMNKSVPVKWRTQIAVWGGTRKNDPYFKTNSLSGAATFHLTEQHAAQVYYSHFSNSPSKESDALNGSTGVTNLSLAPSPDSVFLLNYKILPYYGKVSFSKLSVFNMHLYGTLGIGKINYPGKSFSVTSVGVGDDLYFSKNWGISLDIRGLFYKGPDAASQNLAAATEKPPVDSFKTINTFNMLLNLGIVGLF